LRPLILLSNDDGYSAAGLLALRTELAKGADVIVCAPEVNQSATSHSLSLHRVLRLRRVEAGVFAVDGTPADSVYVALHAGTRVLPRRPDIVVSGMNHGPNLGVDVFYSGTVAAAREGAMQGIPAMAISSDSASDIQAAAALGARLALELCASQARIAPIPKPPGEGSSETLGSGEAAAILGPRHAPLLNVNIPPGKAWRVRGARLGTRLYAHDVVFRHDPRGREYLWIGGSSAHHVAVPGSDTDAYDEGVASVTPLSLDLFAPEHADLAGAVASKV
jgi:5'-nucleotidase